MEMSILLFLGLYPWAKNWLTRIGSGAPRCEVGLEQGMSKASTPSTYTRDKRAWLPRLDPAACHPSPLPVYSVRVYSRGSGSRPQPPPCAAGSLDVCWVGLWILLAMAGISTVHEHLFAFPPPLVRGGVRALLWQLQFFCKCFCLAADLKLL
jgi:hypothetical protein